MTDVGVKGLEMVNRISDNRGIRPWHRAHYPLRVIPGVRRSFDVTSQVQAMYAGTNTGFVVKDSAEDSATSYENKLDSLETANVPELVLTFG